MPTKGTRIASVGIVSGMLWLILLPGGAAGAPISLSRTVPVSTVSREKRVVIAPAAVPASSARSAQSPTEKVVVVAPCGSPIPVCTTFPGTVLVDRCGNVYQVPTATSAQGRERAGGPPMPLAATEKRVGGVTETGHA